MAEAADKQRVRVAIFGQEYALLANAEPEYVSRLAARVDEVMRRLADQHRQHDTVRVAVLTAMSFADEVQRLKDHQEELTALLEAEWRRRASADPGHPPKVANPPQVGAVGTPGQARDGDVAE